MCRIHPTNKTIVQLIRIQMKQTALQGDLRIDFHISTTNVTFLFTYSPYKESLLAEDLELLMKESLSNAKLDICINYELPTLKF